MDEEAALDAELRSLLVGTNELRRRTGQAAWYFHRTLVFWGARGRAFAASTRAWCAGGAAIFDAVATQLRDLSPHAEDARLRAWLAEVLRRLAGDLGRGEHMQHPFVRWLEGRFPSLTAMMREEGATRPILDHALAGEMAVSLGRAARAPGEELPAILRAGAEALIAAPPARPVGPPGGRLRPGRPPAEG